MSRSIKNKVMALAVAGVMAMPMASFAQDQPQLISEDYQEVISVKEEVENEFLKSRGEILERIDRDGNLSIHVSLEDDEYGIVFHLSEDVSIWDRATEELVKSDNLKEGMTVEVFYHKHTPTTMSLPPQLSPGMVVIQEVESIAPTYVGEFNEDLVSLENSLKLNISDDTVIVTNKGRVLKAEDIPGKVVMVFYTMSTKSIPAQTSPSKVVIFEEKVEETDMEEDVEEEVTQEMIPLRARATALGYKVEWNGQSQSVQLTKQNQTIVISNGKLDYTLNKSLGKFKEAPTIKDGTMYVPASILDFMS